MKLTPILLLVGSDLFQQQRYVANVRKQIFPNGFDSMDEDVFDAKEKNMEDILAVANTYPMFSDLRLVVVKNVDTLKEAQEACFLEYVENPNPKSVVLAIAEKMDRRKKLFKGMEKKRYVVSLSQPSKKDLPGWIDEISSNYEITLSSDAKQLLIDFVGPDLSSLDRELQKLCFYVHPSTQVSKEAVEIQVLKATGDTVFAFTNHVMEGNDSLALQTLDYLLSTGTPPLVLVSLLVRHVRILLTVLDDPTCPRPDLCRITGVPPFAIDQYLRQARFFSFADLSRAIGVLADTDYELKTLGLPPQYLLENAVRKICAKN